MIVAVSTIKDTASNVRRYLAGNLAHGVDHFVVFTEDTGAEAEQVLDEHPAVTHVRTGGGWWPERPDDLNARQRSNANMARVMLAPFAWAEWLVHIDGDEVALIDRELLAALPPTQSTFRMDPLEAVSRDAWPEGEVTHFKRLLERRELSLLKVLGLIGEVDNKAYFHGHVRGKVGVRLRKDCRVALHTVKGGKGRFVSTPSQPGLAVLHYDSATAEEFVRKYTTLAASGSHAVYRADRSPILKALRTLADLDLDDESRERHVRRIYERTTQEDFETLDDLGLLVEVRPGSGHHVPEAAPQADLVLLERLLAAAAPLSHDSYTLDHPEGGYDVLRAVLAATGTPAGPAQEILDQVADKVERQRAEAQRAEAEAAASTRRAAEEAAAAAVRAASPRAQLGRLRRRLVARWRA